MNIEFGCGIIVLGFIGGFMLGSSVRIVHFIGILALTATFLMVSSPVLATAFDWIQARVKRSRASRCTKNRRVRRSDAPVDEKGKDKNVPSND